MQGDPRHRWWPQRVRGSHCAQGMDRLKSQERSRRWALEMGMRWWLGMGKR